MVLVPREKQLADALARARRGDDEALAALLRRHSQFPGPKPNLIFADEVAASLAGTPDDAFRVAELLLAHHPGIAPGGTESEFLPVVGLIIAEAALAAAPSETSSRKKRNPQLERVLGWLHDASDDMRFHVRDAAVLVLGRLFGRYEAALWDAVPTFVDNFFPAATFMRTLRDRKVTDGITDAEAAKAFLEHALQILLNASRSDERYPGYKELLAAAPAAWTLLAGRFGPDILETLLPAARSREPGLYNLAAEVVRGATIRGRYPEAVKRIEAARNEMPRRVDPRNERLKKKKGR